ncbi:MAG: chitobiase/beta-hexosaminidase C-terminal domain-containing protein [Bacteroidaceae bacterium]|nr:chitobiase/beta-hexosaminidase C-terminal domain-containing protein [Bacteroidaceae bacterium]
MKKTFTKFFTLVNSVCSAKGSLACVSRTLALLSVLAVSLGVKAQTTLFDTPFQTTYNSTTLSMPYRIPALVETENADGEKELIYFADKRHCGMDIGWGSSSSSFGSYYRIDIVARRSTDGGATWTAEETIQQGTASCGYGDVAVASNHENPKEIVFMAATGNVRYGNSTRSNPIRTTRFYSNDGGQSWSSTDMTSAVYNLLSSTYKGLFFTSGRICQSKQIKVGDYYRLYSALCVYNGSTSNAFVVYSDDFGASWTLLGGGIAVSGGDESAVEELPNGNVVISSRKYSSPGSTSVGRRSFRVFKYSSLPTAANTANGSWESSTYSGIQWQGTWKGTNGELLLVPAKDASGNSCYILLNSVPYGTSEAEGRGNVSIFWKKLSSDAITSAQEFSGTNWNRYSVSTTTSAYSTMILQHDGTISVAYEETIWGKGYSAPEDSYSKQGWTELGYDLKYKNLSLATITNNAYSYRSTTQEPEATVTVATPTFNPAGGEVEEGTTVTISCATDGATIYYTTDGNEPTTSSAVYSGAIVVDKDMTIKAMAAKEGDYTDSEVASATFTIKAREVVATPTFNPAGGEVEEGTTVTISCATDGATIYYTTDGNEPTTTSAVYGGAIVVDKDMTIKAFAAKDGYYTNSAVATAAYTIKQSGGDESVTTVTKYRFKNVSVNGTVRYFAYDSTNGLTLTANVDDAHLYTRTTVDETAGKYYFQSEDGNYLVWKGSAEGYNDNKGYTESYNSTVCVLTVKNLTTSDCYECVSTGVPTGRGYVYIAGKRNDLTSDGVFIVSSSGYFDKTTKPYYTNSYSSAFVIEEVEVEVDVDEVPVVVEAPVIDPDGGEIEEETLIAITCGTDGADIYYTIDGTVPSTTNGLLYSGAFTLSDDATVKAVAVKEGCTDSEVVEAVFTINKTVVWATSLLSCGCVTSSYATLYLDYAVKLPAGVKAYRGVLNSSRDVLTLYQLGNVVPAGCAVILENTNATESVLLTKTTSNVTYSNDLQGTLEEMTISDPNEYYVLGHTANNHLGFYHPNSYTLAANKAYIRIDSSANVRSLTIRYDGDGTTGIEEVNAQDKTDEVVYDLAGRRVYRTEQGRIYIVNGVKQVVK